jgi:MerR family transcriptional regulator, copper efflux regulator
MSQRVMHDASRDPRPSKPETPLLRIGDVAAQAGVSVDTLRFYERRGLLRPAGRRASGYREYSGETVRLVRFIRRSQALGFTLAEVEELVRLRERAWTGDGPRQLREAADAKVRDIDRRVRELRALRGALARLISACDEACPTDSTSEGTSAACTPSCTGTGGASASTSAVLDCPLIEALEDESETGPNDSRQKNDPSRSPKPGRRGAVPKRAPAAVPSSSTRRTR